MPKLIHCRRSGDTKRTLAALRPGQSITIEGFARARAMYGTAADMGLRISVRRLRRGQPQHSVTLIGERPF